MSRFSPAVLPQSYGLANALDDLGQGVLQFTAARQLRKRTADQEAQQALENQWHDTSAALERQRLALEERNNLDANRRAEAQLASQGIVSHDQAYDTSPMMVGGRKVSIPAIDLGAGAGQAPSLAQEIQKNIKLPGVEQIAPNMYYNPGLDVNAQRAEKQSLFADELEGKRFDRGVAQKDIEYTRERADKGADREADTAADIRRWQATTGTLPHADPNALPPPLPKNTRGYASAYDTAQRPIDVRLSESSNAVKVVDNAIASGSQLYGNMAQLGLLRSVVRRVSQQEIQQVQAVGGWRSSLQRVEGFLTGGQNITPEVLADLQQIIHARYDQDLKDHRDTRQIHADRIAPFGWNADEVFGRDPYAPPPPPPQAPTPGVTPGVRLPDLSESDMARAASDPGFKKFLIGKGYKL